MFFVNPQKQQYFDSEGASYLCQSPQWKQEYDVCNCSNCPENCKVRWEKSRFPTDAGGMMQCIRLAQLSDFSFENVDGTIITIPENVIEAIINRAIERCSNDH